MRLSEELPYLNARVRALASRLLVPGELGALARAGSLEEALDRLGATDYRADLAAAQEPKAIRRAEAAVRGHLARVGTALRSFAPGLRKPPCRYLFGVWDHRNLLTVLRGLHAGASADRIWALLEPAGLVAPGVWRELARAGDVGRAAGLAASMGLGLGSALVRGVAEYGRSGLLTGLERQLEADFFARSLREAEAGPPELAAPVVERIRLDLDLRNLAAAVQWFGRHEAPPLDLLLPGGRRTGSRFRQRLASGEGAAELVGEAAGALLRHSGSGASVAAALRQGRAAEALDALRRGGWAERTAGAAADPLSLRVPFAYLARVAVEAANLRRIFWGLHRGRPSAWVEQGLVLP